MVDGREQNRYILERLNQLTEKREQIEKRIREIELEIDHLKNQVIEPAQVKGSFCYFNQIFDKLEPQGKKELIRILVKEVIYDGENKKIKISLYPLPNIDLPIQEISFDECKQWWR